MAKTTLDPNLHCRHATRAQPLVRVCWYRDRDDPCMYCTRIERELREEACAREVMVERETYYKHLLRVRSRESIGTFAAWALELYEDAGYDVGRAIEALDKSACADIDEAICIETHLRMMPVRNRDVVRHWAETLEGEEGARKALEVHDG